MKLGILSTLAALSLLSFAPQAVISQGPPSIIVFPRHPVVVYEAALANVFGTTHEHLIAYSDGHVSYSRRAGPAAPPSADVSAFVEVGPAAVKVLARELRAAGAFVLQDGVVPGLVTATLTVLDPNPTAAARTFSYSSISVLHQPVQAAIDDFIATSVVPNLP